MKQLYRLLWLAVLCIACFAPTAQAQQSLFNVPSSEITTAGKFFVQEQINFNSIIQSNTTVDYGLKHNWEIGLNLLGIDYSELDHRFFENDLLDGDPLAPLLLLNVQKGFTVNHHWKIGLGTQQGFNLTRQQHSRYAQFSYANVVYTTHHERVHVNGGIYQGNTRYLGDGNSRGLMAGVDAALIDHKIHFMADWILGNHDLGVAVIGLVMYPHRRFPISLGLQIPNDRKSPKALVLELTWTP
jgi:hypothetical protein